MERHQSFTRCYKKHGDSGLTPIPIEYGKYKKVNKLWQKLLEQHNVKFKCLFERKKEACNNK